MSFIFWLHINQNYPKNNCLLSILGFSTESPRKYHTIWLPSWQRFKLAEYHLFSPNSSLGKESYGELRYSASHLGSKRRQQRQDLTTPSRNFCYGPRKSKSCFGSCLLGRLGWVGDWGWYWPALLLAAKWSSRRSLSATCFFFWQPLHPVP